MPDANDIALLREYADCNSESAFSEIVHRHINLVYSVALRFTGNSQDAQDVTQAVFVILARKASSLSHKIVLTGWLYETTRYTAMNFLTSNARRQAREQEAYMQSILDSNTESVWRQLAPMLEEAMSRLSEKERTLVALRFFENRSVAETASALGIQEWTARKRVERAIEKVQKFFLKRGIASTTATLAVAISANSVQAAPVALAKSVTAVAIAKGAAASGSTLTLIKGALKIMAWTKAKTVVTAGLIILLIAGTGAEMAYQFQQQRKNSPEQLVQNWQQTLPGQAMNFLWGLKKQGQLSGFSRTDHGSFVFFNIKSQTDALQLLNQINRYPFSYTFVVAKTDDKTKSRFRYSVTKASESDGWHLEKAWRTDANRNVVEEYPIK